MGIPREGTVTFLKELLGKPCCYFAVQPTLEVAIKLTHIWQIVIFSWRSLGENVSKNFFNGFLQKANGSPEIHPKGKKSIGRPFRSEVNSNQMGYLGSVFSCKSNIIWRTGQSLPPLLSMSLRETPAGDPNIVLSSHYHSQPPNSHCAEHHQSARAQN
jgi:hypothetical protein